MTAMDRDEPLTSASVTPQGTSDMHSIASDLVLRAHGNGSATPCTWVRFPSSPQSDCLILAASSAPIGQHPPSSIWAVSSGVKQILPPATESTASGVVSVVVASLPSSLQHAPPARRTQQAQRRRIRSGSSAARARADQPIGVRLEGPSAAGSPQLDRLGQRVGGRAASAITIVDTSVLIKLFSDVPDIA